MNNQENPMTLLNLSKLILEIQSPWNSRKKKYMLKKLKKSNELRIDVYLSNFTVLLSWKRFNYLSWEVL
jgi:hypothetical protein